jgi:hypothetical protein
MDRIGMIEFSWKILEVFSNKENIEKVRFLLEAKDEANTIETEGEHTFLEGSVTKPISEIKEQDLISALIKDTTQDEVNPLKLNLENQLEALKTSKKIDLPWEADTFTIG